MTLLFTFWMLVSAAAAHEAPTTAATITHRPGHVRIELHIDLLAWLQRLAEDDTPVPMLALVDPPRLDDLTARARSTLEQTRLTVDGTAATTPRVTFPSPAAVRELAHGWVMAQATQGHPSHPPPLVLDYRVTSPQETLDITLPASVGAVQVTLVEPRTQMVRSGETARF